MSRSSTHHIAVIWCDGFEEGRRPTISTLKCSDYPNDTMNDYIDAAGKCISECFIVQFLEKNNLVICEGSLYKVTKRLGQSLSSKQNYITNFIIYMPFEPQLNYFKFALTYYTFILKCVSKNFICDLAINCGTVNMEPEGYEVNVKYDNGPSYPSSPHLLLFNHSHARGSAEVEKHKQMDLASRTGLNDLVINGTLCLSNDVFHGISTACEVDPTSYVTRIYPLRFSKLVYFNVVETNRKAVENESSQDYTYLTFSRNVFSNFKKHNFD
ncbi:hypothetical protein EGR_11028 [Echinococcus granulosus]|uniref:Uncharacterized protein n=1 Tax=Echinococcus granulosus TaxID=6210 RepID=W6U6V9_ECHGR|nr:hypothetical protein EGR_11028 [Echinococcus granulosus]EUB54112.1 hypothetical protein EGR_11028 [Echinococcus granulosus]